MGHGKTIKINKVTEQGPSYINMKALGSRELVKQLGIDHRVIVRLVQQGLLRRTSRKTIDSYHAPKFDVDAARQLLNLYNIPN